VCVHAFSDHLVPQRVERTNKKSHNAFQYPSIPSTRPAPFHQAGRVPDDAKSFCSSLRKSVSYFFHFPAPAPLRFTKRGGCRTVLNHFAVQFENPFPFSPFPAPAPLRFTKRGGCRDGAKSLCSSSSKIPSHFSHAGHPPRSVSPSGAGGRTVLNRFAVEVKFSPICRAPAPLRFTKRGGWPDGA